MAKKKNKGEQKAPTGRAAQKASTQYKQGGGGSSFAKKKREVREGVREPFQHTSAFDMAMASGAFGAYYTSSMPSFSGGGYNPGRLEPANSSSRGEDFSWAARPGPKAPKPARNNSRTPEPVGRDRYYDRFPKESGIAWGHLPYQPVSDGPIEAFLTESFYKGSKDDSVLEIVVDGQKQQFSLPKIEYPKDSYYGPSPSSTMIGAQKNEDGVWVITRYAVTNERIPGQGLQYFFTPETVAEIKAEELDIGAALQKWSETQKESGRNQGHPDYTAFVRIKPQGYKFTEKSYGETTHKPEGWVPPKKATNVNEAATTAVDEAKAGAADADGVFPSDPMGYDGDDFGDRFGEPSEIDPDFVATAGGLPTALSMTHARGETPSMDWVEQQQEPRGGASGLFADAAAGDDVEALPVPVAAVHNVSAGATIKSYDPAVPVTAVITRVHLTSAPHRIVAEIGHSGQFVRIDPPTEDDMHKPCVYAAVEREPQSWEILRSISPTKEINADQAFVEGEWQSVAKFDAANWQRATLTLSNVSYELPGRGGPGLQFISSYPEAVRVDIAGGLSSNTPPAGWVPPVKAESANVKVAPLVPRAANIDNFKPEKPVEALMTPIYVGSLGVTTLRTRNGGGVDRIDVEANAGRHSFIVAEKGQAGWTFSSHDGWVDQEGVFKGEIKPITCVSQDWKAVANTLRSWSNDRFSFSTTRYVAGLEHAIFVDDIGELHQMDIPASGPKDRPEPLI